MKLKSYRQNYKNSYLICYFLTQTAAKAKHKKKNGGVGEYKDKIVIHEDFDEPLGDDFWLGEK